MLLHLLDPASDVRDGFFRVGQRHQVVQVLAGYAGPAQVVGDPLGLTARGERKHAVEVAQIERSGTADRHRHTVHDDRIAIADQIEEIERPATADEVVLGDHFEPVDRRR